DVEHLELRLFALQGHLGLLELVGASPLSLVELAQLLRVPESLPVFEAGLRAAGGAHDRCSATACSNAAGLNGFWTKRSAPRTRASVRRLSWTENTRIGTPDRAGSARSLGRSSSPSSGPRLMSSSTRLGRSRRAASRAWSRLEA